MGHEIFFEELGVVRGGGLEGFEDDAFREQACLTVQQGIVAEDELGGGLLEAGGGVDEAAFARDGVGINKCGEVEGFKIRETPGLVLADGDGEFFVFGERGGLFGLEPGGPCGRGRGGFFHKSGHWVFLWFSRRSLPFQGR